MIKITSRLLLTFLLLLSGIYVYAQPSWVTSGAPIGDTSTYIYNDTTGWGGWTGVTLNLNSPVGDMLEVSEVLDVDNPNGVHIYRVDELPSDVSGLPGCTPDFYYGVFLADTADASGKSYTVKYLYNMCNQWITLGNEIYLDVYDRFANDASPWSNLFAILDTTTDVLGKQNELYRGEYMLSINGLEVELGNDTVLCQGGQVNLDVPGCPTSILWNNSIVAPNITTDTTGQFFVEITDQCNNVAYDTINVTIEQLDPTITPVQAICTSDDPEALIAATPGGVWTINGSPNGGTFDPGALGQGTHQIIYTLTGVCTHADTLDVVLNPQPDATIDPIGPFCSQDVAVPLTAFDPGGTWTIDGSPNGGVFDPTQLGTGTYEVIYTIGGICPTADTMQITVNPLFDPTITPIGPFCSQDAVVPLVGVDAGGVWTINGTPNGGTFDPVQEGVGVHEVIYTFNGACPSADTFQVTVNPLPDASITPIGPFCDDEAAVALVGATPGGVWTIDGQPSAGTLDPAQLGAGTYEVIYTVNGICANADTIQVVVNAVFDPAITPIGPFCSQDAVVPLVGVDAGGAWTINGTPNGGTFDPIQEGVGVHEVIYTFSGACPTADTIQVTVNPLPDASIAPIGPFCNNEAAAALTGVTPGGVWTINGQPSAGTFDPTQLGAGTHEVIYTVTGVCDNADTIEVIVEQLMDPTITAIGPFCSADAEVPLIAVDAGGDWYINGISSGANFNPTQWGAGIHEVIYTFSGVCAISDTLEVTVDLTPDASIAPIGPFCDVDGVATLTAASSGGDWTIDNMPNSGTFDPGAWGAGSFEVIYTIGGICPNSDTIMVDVGGTPVFALPADTTICNSYISLDAGNFSSYLWQDGSTSSNYTVFDEGTYYVTVTNSDGCNATDTIVVVEQCPLSNLWIPNVFTPNGDGINDFFFAVGDHVLDFQMDIYNRWGQLIFESHDINIYWDGTTSAGTMVPDGVYVYVVKYYGYSDEGKVVEEVYYGHVSKLK